MLTVLVYGLQYTGIVQQRYTISLFKKITKVLSLRRFRFLRAFENYFMKAIEHFSFVNIASSKLREVGRILLSYANSLLLLCLGFA